MSFFISGLEGNITSGEGGLRLNVAPHTGTQDTAPSMSHETDEEVEMCGDTHCHTDAMCVYIQGRQRCVCRSTRRLQVNGNCTHSSTPSGDVKVPGSKDSSLCGGKPCGPDKRVPSFRDPPLCGGKPCSIDASCVNKTKCYCQDALKEADANGHCPPQVLVSDNDTLKDVLNHSDIIRIMQEHKPGSQTTSMLHAQPTVRDSEPMMLQVVLPLGVLLFIAFLISLVCFRRHRHHRSKRGSDSVVKNNDGALLLDRMNNINKNPTYFLSPSQDPSQRKLQVREICMDHIVLVDIVGEGAFGQVFRGDLLCPETHTQHLVAVKVLKENVANEIREDFEREVEIMAAFDHDNILKLIGVVTQNTGQSPYMIFEYMVHGDLAELLRKNDPMMAEKDVGVIRLQKTDLVDIATQIANGMKYLTSQHFVHRDLATRNCLVGEGLVVKISDFGMSRDIYTCDYYKIGGSRMLPVRWMSPESVKYGRFTSESDAWAYGVVLWEIFSYGRQPYYGHSNEEVIRFLDAGILLQRPEDCPSTIYHIMLGCWKADPKERLCFDKVYMHLQEYHQRLVKTATVHVQSPQDLERVSPLLDLKVKVFADPTVVVEQELQGLKVGSKPSLKVTMSDPKPRTQPLLPDLKHSTPSLTQHRVQPRPDAQPRSEPLLNTQQLQEDLCPPALPQGIFASPLSSADSQPDLSPQPLPAPQSQHDPPPQQLLPEPDDPLSKLRQQDVTDTLTPEVSPEVTPEVTPEVIVVQALPSSTVELA